MRTSYLHQKVSTLLIAASCLIAPTVFGALPTISVNFVGCCNGGGTPTSLDPTDVAGVFPLGNWNNISGNEVFDAALNDSDGAATPVTIWFDADESWGSNAGTTTPNRKMLNGYLGISNDPGNYRPLYLNNVPAGSYRLIMYNGRGDAQNQGYTVNSNAATALHITTESAFTDVWIRGTSTNVNARDVCNYVQFDPVSPVGGTIMIDCRSEDFRGMMNGIQLIPFEAFRILTQPQDATRNEGGSVSFTGSAIDGTGAVTYQWLTNGVVDPSNVTQTYNRSNLSVNENGRTFAIVATDSTALSVTSRVAALTVNSLTTFVSATSNGRTNKVFASFGAAVALTGTYTLNNGATVFSASYGATHKDIVLDTSILVDNATYTLTATGETREDNGDPTVPNPNTITFVHGYGEFCSDFATLPAGAALFKNVDNLAVMLADDGTGTNNVIHLTDDGNNGAYGKLYITNRTLGANLNVLDARWRVRIGGELGVHADGMTFSWANNLATDGNFVAVEEGEGNGLSFVIDTWDNGSGPDTGLDIKWQGARLPGSFLHLPRTSEGNTNFICQDAFVSASASVNSSGVATFTYNGNTVSAVIPGWTGIANGAFVFAARTGGENDNFWVDDVCINNFTLGPVFFTLEPVETTVLEGLAATFSAAVDGSPSYYYQWYTNGVAIPGATSPTYTVPSATEAYNGLLFSVVASNEFSSVTSSNAVLHVNLSPRVVSASSVGNNKVRITYTRNVELGPDFGPPYYDFDNGAFEASRAYGADHKQVVITTDASLIQNTTYILTIDGVTEEGNPGNVLLPNPTVVAFHHGYGSVCADFEAGLPPGASVIGTATASGGVLHITDAINSQQGNFFLPDPNGGFPVDRLLVTFKAMISGGTCCGGRGADGMSFNVASDINASSSYGEEGLGSGLTVTFDTWDNLAPDTAPSIEVRYKGTVVAFQSMAGVREPAHPPQTPFIFDANGNALALNTSNQFANVRLSVAPDGKLDLYFKNQIIFQNLQLPNYTPFTGANFGIGARTGGANDNHWIDDLCINAFTLGEPTITQEPADQTIFEVPPPRFSFGVGVNGLPPYSVQWYSNGVPIAGATALTYITPPLLRAASGSGYQAIINNEFGSVTSRVAIATIELNDPTKQFAVSFTGRGDCAPGCSTLAPADAAGLLAQGNWNNIDNSGVFNGTSGLLNDSNAVATHVTLTYDANDSWNNDGASTTPNEKMFKGISKANGADHVNTYTFNNVRPGFLYDVIVYLNVNGDNRIGDISCGGKTYYFTSQHSFGGSFIQITNTLPGGARDTGNFVRFLSVAPNAALSNIVVGFINRGDPDGVGIAGFQITPASSQKQLAVSFTGRGDCAPACSTLAPTDVAGVAAQGNWNNIVNDTVFNGVSGVLNDSNAEPTTVTLTYNANDAWNNDGASGTPNEKLYKGISKSFGANNENTYIFNNVRPGNYDVIVYLNVNGDGRIGDLSCNGTTYYYTSQHSFGGTFIQITNATSGAARDTGNYVRFYNVPANGANQIVLSFINRGDPDGVGIAGFQLLPGTPVTQLAVSFTGRGDCAPGCATLAPTTSAGLIPQANWNNIFNDNVFNGTSAPLGDLNGGTTSATLTYDANDSWNNDQSPVVSGDQQMMKGISKANGTDRLNTYTFNDVRPGLYDVIVYLNVNGDNRIGDFACNGVTYYITSQHQFGGTFIRGLNTSPGGTRDLCNYVRFFGVDTGPAGRIRMTMTNRGDPDGVGIAGFQLVPSTGPVLISAASLGNPNGVRLGFTLPMGASALNPANYSLTYAGSQVAQISPSDAVIGVAAAPGSAASSIAVVGTTGGANNYPSGENPTMSIDNNTGTKYLNFIDNNVGTIVTRAAGATTVTGFRFSTANDANERDPVMVSIEGTTSPDPTTAAGGATWTSIYSGPSGLAADPGRSTAGPLVSFANATAFNTYRILVTSVRAPAGIMQYSEVQLYAGAPGGSIAITGAAYASANSNQIQLTTATPLTFGDTYTVTAANVQDATGVTLAPNPSSRSFTHGSEFNVAAGLTVKRFDGSADFNNLLGKIAACVVPQRFSTAIARMEYQTSENANPADGNTFADANTADYGVWIYGQFVAPTTGNYMFGLANDDFARLYLSTDSDPAHKVLLIEKPAWGGFRDFVLPANGNTVAPLAGPIPLVAGRTYYMEAMNAEGGGGDTLSVAVQVPGGPAIVDGTSHVIPRSMFATNYSIGCPPSVFFQTLGPITITEQPANQVVVELFNAAFYVGLDGTPAYTVQWYSNNVAVPGATSQAYNPQVNRFADGSQWFAIVANDFSRATSSVVTLTVISDTIAPLALRARGSDSFTNATIVFNEPVAVAGATTAGNYSITNDAGVPLAILGVGLRDNTNVVIHTAPQTQGERYTIVINNVTDRAGIPNPIAPNTTVSFHGWVYSPGFALMEVYATGGGNTVNLLTGHPTYPHYPSERYYMLTPNSRNAYPNDSHEAYGGRISGLLVPPVSGNYQFSINNDDDALLRGALTDNPGDLQDVGAQACCSGTFRNTGPALPLVGGNRYAYQLLWKEGTGGDYAALSADGVNPIPADYLAVYANPDAVSLVFTTNLPPFKSNFVNQLPTLTVAAQVTSFDGAVRPLLYQWYSNGVAIAGATGPSYTTAIMKLANEGDIYTVLARTPGATLLSVSSTQHVTLDDVEPWLEFVKTDATFTKIHLRWSEIMNEGTAIEPSSYLILDPQLNQIFVDTVGFDPVSDGSNVVLNLVSPLGEGIVYSVEADFQMDLAGNAPDPVGNPEIDTEHGVKTNVSSWVSSPCGGVEFSLFNNLSTGDNNIRNTLLADPRFPNNPTQIAHIDGMSSRLFYPNDSVEGYGARMRGLFIPPTSGNWIFYIRSDDSSILYMNTNGPNAAGKVIVQEEAGCCGAFAGHPTVPITLTAGQGYYIEMVYKEGTGGDYGFTAARLQGQPAPTSDTTDPIPGTMMGAVAAPGGIGGPLNIVSQPVDVNTAENTQVSFTFAVSSPNDLPICYQWRRDGSDIPGAISRTYTIPSVTLADNGAVFSCVASIIGAKQTSANALLTVVADTNAPLALTARGIRLMNAVKITFSEAMSAGSATEGSNYTITDSNGAPVIATGTPVLSGDGQTVTIPTPVLNEGALYHVAISGLADLVGNPLVSTNLDFRAWVVGIGSLLFEAYNTGGGNDVSILTGHPSYPNSPDYTQHIDQGDSRRAYPTDIREAYGARLSGYFVPQQTTNYTFYLRSDDASSLSLSTDSSPANLVPLTAEPGCCGPFSAHASGSISLVAGQSYYMELLYKEGVGGDYGQVAVKRTSSPQDPNTLSTINGALLSSLADPMGAFISITQQPLSQVYPVAATPVPLLSENFNSGDGGFTVVTPLPYAAPWTYSGGSGSWIEDGQGPGNGQPDNDSTLLSPIVTTTAAGNVVVSFSHRYSFEHDGGGGTAWDGGQLRVSINGAPATTVPGSAFTQNGYNGTPVAIGTPAFVGTSAGHGVGTKITSTADLGFHPSGTTIRIQFFAANDENTKGNTPNWEIDSVDIAQGSSPLNVTLGVGFTATNDYGDYNQVAYQWQQNVAGVWKNVLGQNGSVFVTVPTPGLVTDYRVKVYIPGASATSAAATVVGLLSVPWVGPGTLQWADQVTGPWSNVPSPTNPYIYDPRLGPMKFFRVLAP